MQSFAIQFSQVHEIKTMFSSLIGKHLKLQKTLSLSDMKTCFFLFVFLNITLKLCQSMNPLSMKFTQIFFLMENKNALDNDFNLCRGSRTQS